MLPAVSVLVAAGPAQASAADARLCVPVRLTGAGQDLGPDSQGRLHTIATVSLAGYPIGTTQATFTPSGPPAGTSLAFTGPIVFTPTGSTATVTAEVRGSVDLGSGQFVASTTSVTGSGVLRGASGSLTFRGTEDLGTGAFTETIRGTVCDTAG